MKPATKDKSCSLIDSEHFDYLVVHFGEIFFDPSGQKKYITLGSGFCSFGGSGARGVILYGKKVKNFVLPKSILTFANVFIMFLGY